VRGLYVVAAVVMAGTSAVFVLLAELEHRYGLSTGSLGLIAGSAFAAALATQLGLARYADRGYGGLLLRVGVAMASVGLLWFAAATELWQFVAARALLGASVGMIIPAARRAIVLASDGNLGERLGVFYAAYLAGFVFGPPVAGFLTVIADVRLPFLVLGIAVAVSGLSLRGVVVDAPGARDVPLAAARKRVLRRLITARRVIAAMLIVVSFRYSVGVFEPLWATYLDSLGASTFTITISLTVFALPMLIIAKWAGRLSDRFGPRLTSVLAAAATVPLMAAYGFVGLVPVVMLMAVPHGIGEAIQSPGTQAAVADASPVEDTAAAQGLAEAAGSAAAAIGAFTAAPLFSALGPGPAWLIAAIVMACLIGTSALLDRPRLVRAGRHETVPVAPGALRSGAGHPVAVEAEGHAGG
jgi:MFS transporter, DHA1 family, multidrug resistance protein